MSHLDYLNKNEWKKLGIVSFIALLSAILLLFLFYLVGISDAGVKVEGEIIAKYILGISAIYSAIYTLPSFLLLYFKGEKAFKPLIVGNFVILFGATILLLLLILFGPHG